jgi:hypothetical protein
MDVQVELDRLNSSDLLSELSSDRLNQLRGEEAVSSHVIKSIKEKITGIESKLKSHKDRIELMKMASILLQELVDKVSRQNINKIEGLVDSALKSIFYDQDLTFKINQAIKRNVNTYSFSILQDGEPGTIHSYGGGVVCVIAFVLKALTNILTKSFPLLLLDESLAFCSDKYIPTCSAFQKELTDEFNLIQLLISHKSKFGDYADRNFNVSKQGDKTLIECVAKDEGLGLQSE